jgi:FKBP-type peptidyl-prolyl cis-trans isomerase SlyD
MDLKAKKRVVSFHYTLTDEAGEVLDSSSGDSPLTYLEGVGQIIPGLESELSSLLVGSKKKVVIPADQAYGEHDDALVMDIPRAQFAAQEVKVGDQFQASLTGDPEEASLFTVLSVSEEKVTVDGNHPLAGMVLTFDVEVTDIRDATDVELAHGHAHGPGGHHHD